MAADKTSFEQPRLLWGYRYQLCERWADYYAWGGVYTDYCYAEPTLGANGCDNGAVWICDAKGRLHPRFGWHPIHHKISSLHTPVKIQVPHSKFQAKMDVCCEIFLSCPIHHLNIQSPALQCQIMS